MSAAPGVRGLAGRGTQPWTTAMALRNSKPHLSLAEKISHQVFVRVKRVCKIIILMLTACVLLRERIVIV